MFTRYYSIAHKVDKLITYTYATHAFNHEEDYMNSVGLIVNKAES